MALDREVWASESIPVDDLPIARPRLIAAAAGLVHVALALTAVAVAVRLAVQDQPVACVEPTCLSSDVDAVMYAVGAYAVAFAVWTVVLRRLLERSAAGLRRLRPAMTIHLVVGALVVAAGLAVGGYVAQLAVLIAAQVVPTAVAWWAASPLVRTPARARHH